MKLPRTIPLTVVGFVLGIVSMGQGAEMGISLRLLACEVTREPLKVMVATKDSSSEVEVPSMSFSPPVEVSGHALEIKTTENGELLCSATLPEEGRSFALMLAPKGADGFDPVMVRLDDDAFRPGDFQFINRSGKTVVVKLGATEVVIESNGVAKARPTGAIDNRYHLVTMSSRGESGDKVFASTRWPVDDSKRGYILFLAKPGGRVSYRSIEEFVSKP